MQNKEKNHNNVSENKNRNQICDSDKKQKAFMKAYNELNSKLRIYEMPYLDLVIVTSYLKEKANDYYSDET